MIKIDDAIIKSKEMENVSNGGSKCYDFEDVVLVKYVLPLEYVKPGYRSRENQEEVMKRINEKIDNGLNSPRHIEMKRVVEGNDDICYVLQEKCKGKNCESMSKYGVSVEQRIEELIFVNMIPFEQYVKLVSDSCMIYEMGYEGKNKNLFYDEETGFWFIDFLSSEVDNVFDENNPKKVFETIKYISPKPIQIASRVNYNTVLSENENKRVEELTYASNAKYLLACKKAILNFEKYEYFYLFKESDEYKKYLMDNGFVSKNLLGVTDDEIKVYNELYSFVVANICDEISEKGKKYWDVEANDIRINSDLFSLTDFYKKHLYKDTKKDDYEDEWDFDRDVSKSYTSNMMNDIYNKLCLMESNDNILSFISEYKSKIEINPSSK